MENNGAELILTGLFVYPIKSLKGIPLTEANVEGRGLQYDRRWMLVDQANRFRSQRENSLLALLSVRILPTGLEVSAAGREPLLVPFEAEKQDSEEVTIWQSNCPANVVSNAANAWFTEVLGEAVRLVHMPDHSKRIIDPEYSVADGAIVSFADGYPFLIANESSLDELNSRLATPITMNRFRPNFVVSGAKPFVEDNWKQVSIGDTSFHVVKPSARCVMTTIDQEHGERSGDEPLRTLATYRRRGNDVHFGQNLMAAQVGGKIGLGDRLRVLEMK